MVSGKPQQCNCYDSKSPTNNCQRVATRFVGNKKHGWLRFCSKQEHRATAFAYNEYLRLHPNAR